LLGIMLKRDTNILWESHDKGLLSERSLMLV
jgi:hypothetical protein